MIRSDKNSSMFGEPWLITPFVYRQVRPFEFPQRTQLCSQNTYFQKLSDRINSSLQKTKVLFREIEVQKSFIPNQVVQVDSCMQCSVKKEKLLVHENSLICGRRRTSKDIWSTYFIQNKTQVLLPLLNKNLINPRLHTVLNYVCQ